MITVYHTTSHLMRELRFLISDDEMIEFARTHSDDYNLVATVDSDSLDDAYTLTNSINHGWWENENVTSNFKEDGCRSTMMGDIIRMNDETYVVAYAGFIKI